MKPELTKSQLFALAQSFPQKWFVSNGRVLRCYVIDMPGHPAFCAYLRYGHIEPVNATTYDTEEQARSARDANNAAKKKELDKALDIVSRYFSRNRWDLNKRAKADKRIKDIIDAGEDAYRQTRIHDYRIKVDTLLEYIRTGTIQIGATSFRKEEVAFIQYGHRTVTWDASSAPIRVTLKNGDNMITRSRKESGLLQDIFGYNKNDLGFRNVKWETPDGEAPEE